MFSVIHKKVTVKVFSIFLIFFLIIGLLPQLNVTADSVNQVDSPPAQLEILEGSQVELVTTDSKLVTYALHVKSPQSGAFFVWDVADPAANGSIDIAEANSQANISYMPAGGFSGVDRFTIRVNDTQGNTGLVFFHILVENEAELGKAKEPPIPAQHSEPQLDQFNSEKVALPMDVEQQTLEPVNDHPTLRIAQGESLTLQMKGESVKRITLDAIGAEPMGLTWRVTQMPAQGEVFLTPSGTSVEVIYKPDGGFREFDTLTLGVIDSYGNKAETRLFFGKEKTSPVLESMPSDDVQDQSQNLSEDGGSTQSEIFPSGINETYPLGEDTDAQPGGVSAFEPSGLQQQLLATPYIDVYPQDDYIIFYNWTPNTEVTLTIGSDVWTTTSDSGGYGYFWLAYIFDIQTGQDLVVNDEVFSRTHTVIDLRMTSYDLASASISGVANQGVLTVSRGDTWEDVEATADSSGQWTATFTSDLVAGSYGTLTQADDDGDTTYTTWSIPNPMLTIVKSGERYIQGTGWPADLPKTVFINDVQVAVIDDDSASFDYYSEDPLSPGTIVRVESGTYFKEHTVIDLRMTGFDLAGDSISGVADPGVLTVSRWDAYEELEATADSSGLWTAAFTSDLVAGSYGYLSQTDDDGDRTYTAWSIPNPMLTIDKYYSNTIRGTGWPSDLPKTVFINDVQVAVIDYDSTSFNYYPEDPLIAGTVVRVESGIYSKEHIVIDLRMTGTDLANNSISGIANPGVLTVSRGEYWEDVETIADSSGLWTATFTSDLIAGSYGSLSQADDDGDRTYTRWSIPNPMLTINMYSGTSIQGSGWPADLPKTIFINDVQVAVIDNDSTSFNYYPEDPLLVGMVIRVESGTYSKEHTVIDLRMTSFDLAGDSISGVANPGVLIASRSDTWEDVETTADSSSLWTATFTTDLVAGSNGYLSQADGDGDKTYTRWSIPNPMLTIDKFVDWGITIQGSGWPADLPKTIFINNVQVAVLEEYSTSFEYYPEDPLSPGTIVRVESGTYTKEHTVIDLRMTSFDLAGDSISGVGNPGVLIASRSDTWEDVETTADGSGLWTATFTTELIAGSYGYLSQADGDGDRTFTSWSIPNPMLTIDKTYWNLIAGSGWPADLPKTIFVDGVQVAVISDNSTSFDYFSDVPLPAGTVVRVECGNYFKEHTVIDLRMTGYDLPGNSISGVANEGELFVSRWDESEEHTAAANASGLWSQVFSNTLVKGAQGQLSQSDLDGDSTQVRWNIPDPHVQVYIKSDYISSWGWRPGDTVTISLNGIVQATVTADSGGGTWNWISTDIVGGDTVLLSNGTDSVTHVVKDISITWYDEEADTIWGTAEPGEVGIEADDSESWESQTIQVGSDHLWTADFSGLVNIGPGTYVRLSQYDVNSNSTIISWDIRATSMDVYLQNNDIYTRGWPDNIELTLSVNGTVVETQTVSGSSWLYPQQTLIPGDVVTISSSLVTITHIIRDLSVTSWDFTAETVSGKAPADSELTVAVYDGSDWYYQDVVANSSGDWTADFATIVDIKPGIGGWLIQYDGEGNSTQNPWHIRNPYFYVYLQFNEVYGYDWHPNSTITLTIGGQSWTTQSDSGGWFYMYLSPFDIMPGFEIQVSDSIDTRTHIVKNLSITNIDVEGDILTGTADTGELRVRVCSSGNCYSKYPVANEEGIWTEDFTDTIDVTLDSDGYLYQYDDQGNNTRLYWYQPNPYFYVYLNNNRVYGDEWSPNSTITVTIGGQSWETQTDSYGEFDLSISQFQIIPGTEVRVSDGISTRTHTVKNLSVTNVDVNTDMLTGTADPGWLEVMACTSGYCYDEYPVADGDGIWTVDFNGNPDITLDTYGYIYQFDDQGNYTVIYWYVPNPYFYVYHLTNVIYGNEWSPNATITISTMGQSWTDRSDSGGWFSISLSPFDILPGQTITVSDGHSTRTHKVKNLSVTNVDIDGDILTGTADPGELRVRACTSGYCYYKYPVANGDGIWTEDFTGTTDITPDSYGYLYQYDLEGNYTVIYWYQPDPIIRANLSNDVIDGDRWPAFVEVNISVDGVTLGTRTSDSYGGFYIYLEDDLVVGQEIVITSPEYATVTYTTQDIAFEGYDITEDTVWGTAEDGIVYVEACNEEYGYYDCYLIESSVTDGAWIADFTEFVDLVPGSQGSAFIYDENDNSTEVSWFIPNPRFGVYLPGNLIFGSQWPIGSDINVNISGVADTFQTVANEYGRWDILIEGATIVPGMTVTVTGTIPNSASTIQREHLVRNITVTKMDYGLDTVEGTAEPGVLLDVFVIDASYHYGYREIVLSDSVGHWIADFSSTIDIIPGFSVQVAQDDDDGDSTVAYWQPELFSIYLPQIRR